MASDENAKSDDAGAGQSPTDVKANKPKPTRSLPTDRVGLEKQFVILRAYAKASLAVDRAPVSNNDVARYADIAPSSISVCNPFFNDAGLLIREGIKQRPVEAVFDYDQASDWNPDRAASKLSGVLAASWFGKALLTKLALRPSTIADSAEFLAEECRAPVEYKDQIRLLLDYLAMAGLIVIDGNAVTKANAAPSEGQRVDPEAKGDSKRVELPPPPPPATGIVNELHPFIQGLIKKLPSPESPWELRDRAKWLTTAANIFDLMYTVDDDKPSSIDITLQGSTLGVVHTKAGDDE